MSPFFFFPALAKPYLVRCSTIVLPDQNQAGNHLCNRVGISSVEFAKIAKISPSTLSILESTNKDVSIRSIEKVGMTLEQKGIIFIPASEGRGPGIRLKPKDESLDICYKSEPMTPGGL